MTRRALPVLVVASAIAAASGCTCTGDVSRFGPSGGNGNYDGGGLLPDGGRPPKTDGGPDGGAVDICKIIFCPDGGGAGFNGTVAFPPPGGFSLDGGSTGTTGEGVTVDPQGRITLNSEDIQLNYAWIANWKAGTVSKYDTKNLLPDGGIHEVGRYVSVFPRDGLGNPTKNTNASQVYDPSRTAVDLNGDVWVANFASHTNQYFSVTKIAGSLPSCIDRNGDGKIQTSFDDPANPIYGVIESNEFIRPSDPTDPLKYDECVLFTQELGAQNVNGYFGEGSISINGGPEGAPGDIWVGTWLDRKLWRLDPNNGTIKPMPGGAENLAIPGIEPYGSAVDSKNRLWIVDRVRNNLTLVDTNTQTVLAAKLSPPSGITVRSGYGIAVDQKQRVWIPGWGAGPFATRYDPGTGDPTTGTWQQFTFNLVTPDGGTIKSPRGVTVDDKGIVYMTSDQRGGASSGSAAMAWGFDSDDGGVRVFPDTGVGLVDATSTFSKTSIGVGLDEGRNLWVNNSSGNVMRIDAKTGAVTTSANQSGALYTYSDFTGYQLRHVTTSNGFFRQTVAGCSRYAQWDTVTWNATTPPNTKLLLYVRGSNNLDFSVSQRYGPWDTSPANLQAAPGPVPQFKYLQLEFFLASLDGTTQPYLNGFDVKSECLTPLQ